MLWTAASGVAVRRTQNEAKQKEVTFFKKSIKIRRKWPIEEKVNEFNKLVELVSETGRICASWPSWDYRFFQKVTLFSGRIDRFFMRCRPELPKDFEKYFC